MVDPDSLTYEVGKYKPPKEHQFQPGNRPMGHRRKGTVGLARMLRDKLGEEIPGKGKTVAEALVTKVVAEALRNPSKYWPILKTLMDQEVVEEAPSPEGWVEPLPAEIEEKKRRLEEHLLSMPAARRGEVVRILADIERAVSGGILLGGHVQGVRPMPPSSGNGHRAD